HPRLETVGHRRVVHRGPGRRLRAVAHGWPGREFRTAPRPSGAAVTVHAPCRHGDECRCGCALAKWSTGTDIRSAPESAGRSTPTGGRWWFGQVVDPTPEPAPEVRVRGCAPRRAGTGGARLRGCGGAWAA